MRTPLGHDGIALEFIRSRLVSIADEAAAALRRTAFSTIVRESNDFAVVLMDPDGASLAENTIGVPSFVGIMPRTVKSLIRDIPLEEWNDGDCVATNDPWLGTGHLPDLMMAAPIFMDGVLLGFSATVAHLPDIGGAIFSADCRDFFEEGLRIPPIKLISAGRENADVFRFIRANVRVPDHVVGDIYAQVTAHSIVRSRLIEFLRSSGLKNLRPVSSALLGRAERAMRKAIKAVPDGTYHASVKADGYDGKPTHIVCSVEVADDELIVDYDGTSPQADRGLNAVYNYTYAYTVYPLKCVLDPTSPNNEGSYRPITVKAPLGSILNPRFPAPCNARQLTGQLLAGALYKCLSQVIPDRVVAESGNAPTLRAVFSGVDQAGSPFSQMLMCSGGMGASAAADGHACTPFPTNTGSGSIEAFEGLAPLLVMRKELTAGSGGPGKFRGGLGQEIEIKVLGSSPIALSLMCDRIENPPQGLLGGGPGQSASVRLSDGRALHPKARCTLQPDDHIILRYAGAGGFGPPAARDPDLVRQDLANGYVREDVVAVVPDPISVSAI